MLRDRHRLGASATVTIMLALAAATLWQARRDEDEESVPASGVQSIATESQDVVLANIASALTDPLTSLIDSVEQYVATHIYPTDAIGINARIDLLVDDKNYRSMRMQLATIGRQTNEPAEPVQRQLSKTLIVAVGVDNKDKMVVLDKLIRDVVTAVERYTDMRRMLGLPFPESDDAILDYMDSPDPSAAILRDAIKADTCIFGILALWARRLTLPPYLAAILIDIATSGYAGLHAILCALCEEAGRDVETVSFVDSCLGMSPDERHTEIRSDGSMAIEWIRPRRRLVLLIKDAAIKWFVVNASVQPWVDVSGIGRDGLEQAVAAMR